MRRVALAVVVLTLAGGLSADDRVWEDPIFESWQEAVAAAEASAGRIDDESPRAQRFFIEMTLGADHRRSDPSNGSTVRENVGNLLVTHPEEFTRNPVQRSTVERFLGAAPKQQRVLEGRLARFGYPELNGVVFLRLVESVDAFAGLNAASSDKMSQVGGSPTTADTSSSRCRMSARPRSARSGDPPR